MRKNGNSNAIGSTTRSSILIRWIGCGLVVALLGWPGFALGQDSVELEQKRSDDTALLDGLRQRRLYDIAAFYCRDQLAQLTIDPTTQATLVVELMKTLTAEAILSDAASRETVWKAVEATSTEFARDYPDHPRKFLVQVQQALSHIARSQLLQQELDAQMATDAARIEALNQIRTARALLGDLQRDISKAIPDQRGRTLTEHELTSEQLLTLNNNVQYQLAVCNLNRAQLYEASDRLNRIDAINGVILRLNEVRRSTSEGQPLWWKTKLGQIQCYLLLGAPDDARDLAQSLAKIKTSASNRIRLLELKAHVAIDLGVEDYALSVLSEFEDLNVRTAPLELAKLELAVDLAARATTEERKQEWILFAAESSKSIARNYGGYWGRRADLILISATGIAKTKDPTGVPIKLANPDKSPTDGSNNVELNLLIRLADEAARKELLDDALKAYDRAAKMALSLNQPEQALRLDFRAGKILEKQGKHGLAAERLMESAIDGEPLSLASSVHLVGCWNFAKSIENNQPEKRKQFEEHLLDHLRRWPSETSVHQVRIWLAGELQAGKKWNEAFDTYAQVGNDSPLLETAIDQAIVCASRALVEQQRTGRSTQSTAAELIGKLSQKLGSLQEADPIAIELKLACAELDLIFGSRTPNPALAKTLEPFELTNNVELANSARAIHAVSLSIEQPEIAKQLITQIVGDERALGLCERCLAGILENPDLAERLTSVNRLRLAVIESALELPVMQQPDREARKTSWMLKQSAALTALDRQGDAIVVLQKLEKKFPRNAGVQMQLARALTVQFEKTDPKKALDKWRRIAARLQSHTSNWFEAKYEVARLLIESGDAEAARKLLKFIQAIPPGWDSSPLKPEFEKLLRRSQRD